MEDWVVLRRFFLVHEAHLARHVLQAAGIEAKILHEISSQVYNFFNPGDGGILLQVKEHDVATAHDLLAGTHPEISIDENFEVGQIHTEHESDVPPQNSRSVSAIENWILLLIALIVISALAAFTANLLK